MRMPRRPDARATRTTTLGVIALAATALVLVAPITGAGESALRAAAAAWRDVFSDRPRTAFAQRMIVVLAAPSLADRMAAAETPPTPEEQRRWVAEADAAQKLLLSRLRERGVELEPEYSFTRTMNGFSAMLDPRALAELERMNGVAGVYPVRTVYPASIAADVFSRREFAAGAGRRTDVVLPGFDGRDVKIALLDTGVDLGHPYLHGRVSHGVDVVGRDDLAAAEAKPDDASRLEAHGTRMAGILIGAGGPAGITGVAPGAEIFPIRVLGWERVADGSYAVVGRGDGLIAGLEGAVDPDGRGDVNDAAKIALAALVEPYAAFADGPEARAVAGAAQLGTLVVTASGNDGRAASGFGSVGAPGGAAAALTVGALDLRRELLETRVAIRVGDETILDDQARVLGAVPPRRMTVAAQSLLGASLADPARARNVLGSGALLAEFFDADGVSRVAGRAAVLPAGNGSLDVVARNAAAAGASAVVVYGTPLPGGALDLDESAPVPVLAVSADAGRRALEALAAGNAVTVSIGAPDTAGNALFGAVAPFSSGGLSFDGRVKPDVVAAGVGIATSDAGANGDGSPRFATATGTSVSAAVAAGTAALVAQARPGLTPAELKSLIVGSARQIVRDGEPEPVTLQGAGAVDAAAAASAEVAVEPSTLAFGRVDGEGWRLERGLFVRNLSTRQLEIDFGIARDESGDPEVAFAAEPAHLSLAPGASGEVTLFASSPEPAEGRAGGTFVVIPQGSRPIRVPWAVSFRDAAPPPLLADVALSHREFAPSDSAPAVLAFRAGSVVSDAEGRTVEPVAVLEATLWTSDGKRLGLITRLRDLLPGRYALGLTGRSPSGKELRPGDYVIQLRALPVAGEQGADASIVRIRFTISP